MKEVVSVTLKPNDLGRKFSKYAREIGDTTQANRELSIQLYSIVLRRFETAGASSGQPWTALKPGTAARKARDGYSPLPLTRTGILRASFFPGFYSKKEAGVRSRVPYASAHQEGVPERNLPARPMLPDKEEALEAAINVYENHIERARKRAGL